MKSLIILLSIAPLLVTAQSRKVQFEVDSSLYWEARSVVLVLDANDKKDTLEFDSNKSKVFEVKGPCSGQLVLIDNEFWKRECSFSVRELKADSILLFVSKEHGVEPILLSTDIIQATHTIHLSPVITVHIGNGRTLGDSSIFRGLKLSGGLSEPIGAAPEIRGCRGISGVNIDPKSFEKPALLPESDLPGVAPEFENGRFNETVW